MPSQLQLVNACLSEVGRPPVSNVNDSPDSQFISAKISTLYPEVLLECNWNWAIVYREDNTPLTMNFSPDYVYSYRLPGDFGQFYKWASTGAQWPIYAIVDGMLLAQTQPVQYYYITNQASFEVLSPLFSRTLVLYAAAKSALVLTSNTDLTKYLEVEYEKMRSRAILQNDMERSVMTMPYNDFDRRNYV